jgi:hypothetical protein
LACPLTSSLGRSANGFFISDGEPRLEQHGHF